MPSTSNTTAGNPAADGLTPGTIIGTPYSDVLQWDGRQTASDDCAIRAQQFIIEQFTGQKLSEQDLEKEAQAHGWYSPGHGGTPIADMGKLLEQHGVAVDTFTHATVTQLANELAQGHKVIIAVNAEDLWKHDPALAGTVQNAGSQSADHAVVVSGIDTTDPNHPKVMISDPGTGEAIASYPLDEFLTAWKTSDFAMTATHDPAPSSLPEMVNFNYATGHIPEVMGLPYEEFAMLPLSWGTSANPYTDMPDPFGAATGWGPGAMPEMPEWAMPATAAYHDAFGSEDLQCPMPWDHVLY